MEYASSVRDPHLQKDINKLEITQRRSASFVTNKYHNTSFVETMLRKLQWPTLEERRKKARLTLLYKVGNKLLPPARLSRQTNVRCHRARPASGKSPSIQNRYPQPTRPSDSRRKYWLVQETTAYILTVNVEVRCFICTCKTFFVLHKLHVLLFDISSMQAHTKYSDRIINQMTVVTYW